MDFEKAVKLNNRELPPKMFRELAYHEAGHAAITFLVGERSHFTHINMTYNAKTMLAGYVRRNRVFVSAFNARRNIIDCLAGPAAEQKFVGEDRDLSIRERWYSLSDSLVEFEHAPGTDIYCAIQYAKTFLGHPYDNFTERKLWSVVARCGEWAIELMDEPRVWQTVSALADRLEPEKVMSGETAWEIMEQSWGSHSSLPLRQLGRKWRARLFENKGPEKLIALIKGLPEHKAKESEHANFQTATPGR